MACGRAFVRGPWQHASVLLQIYWADRRLATNVAGGFVAVASCLRGRRFAAT